LGFVTVEGAGCVPEGDELLLSVGSEPEPELELEPESEGSGPLDALELTEVWSEVLESVRELLAVELSLVVLETGALVDLALDELSLLDSLAELEDAAALEEEDEEDDEDGDGDGEGEGEGEGEGLGEATLQERSKSGWFVTVFPITPKLGLGVWPGSESWNVYHHVLVFPNRSHPTSFQNVLAFSTDGTARPTVLPLTGNPVSVIQTGLPWTAALVASSAL